ncbi:putative ATPase [Variovorax boronicumulans]|uniref:AAA family ATPase n=1 Tax=Variovorax boronicumulans TaxID=436515 RepID=UPI002784FFD8|nr:AAA family ATPase [Variovorax boronicumulans]MDQ0013453.1 putative ATPase [Variovorax boronicumulans]
MQFKILSRNTWTPSSGKNTVYLRADNWNDFSFVTLFKMSLHDKDGQAHDIGATKIGFKGQTTEVFTQNKIPQSFENLDEEFFSLGQGVEFYKNLALLPKDIRQNILISLRDIVAQPEIIEEIKEEKVFGTSLLRDTSLSVIKGQYARVLERKSELTDFKFKFTRPESEKLGGIDLGFKVTANSTPSTNIHAIIGRNGVGKTTLLNGLIDLIAGKNGSGQLFDLSGWKETKISDDYFSSLVSVSFSAFDPFTPPQEQSDPAKGTCYFYIGLKDALNAERHRNISELRTDCIHALSTCFQNPEKTTRWINAIEKLGSDENFSSMKLNQLEESYNDIRDGISNDIQSDSDEFKEVYSERIDPYLSRMSSGHAIVLLTITRLVATVEEKTLVLLDEPESHLHPPLLSAFVRALADLLHDKNGVAIIATHSPVVLQEIPKSCVWKIHRVGKSITFDRPAIETFGENVGSLTSEVFSLEVERSGFHELLSKSVASGRTYEEIVADYNQQLGFEARAILKALLANRDRNINHDAAN